MEGYLCSGLVLRRAGVNPFEAQHHATALQDPQAEYEALPWEHELLSVVSQIVEAAGRTHICNHTFWSISGSAPCRCPAGPPGRV